MLHLATTHCALTALITLIAFAAPAAGQVAGTLPNPIVVAAIAVTLLAVGAIDVWVTLA